MELDVEENGTDRDVAVHSGGQEPQRQPDGFDPRSWLWKLIKLGLLSPPHYNRPVRLSFYLKSVGAFLTLVGLASLTVGVLYLAYLSIAELVRSAPSSEWLAGGIVVAACTASMYILVKMSHSFH